MLSKSGPSEINYLGKPFLKSPLDAVPISGRKGEVPDEEVEHLLNTPSVGSEITGKDLADLIMCFRNFRGITIVASSCDYDRLPMHQCFQPDSGVDGKYDFRIFQYLVDRVIGTDDISCGFPALQTLLYFHAPAKRMALDHHLGIGSPLRYRVVLLALHGELSSLLPPVL